MAPSESQDFYGNASARVQDRVPELGWLSGQRRAALETLARHGLPAPRSENWRYTPIEALMQRSLSWLDPAAQEETPGAGLSSAMAPLALPGATHIQLVDGIVIDAPARTTGLAVHTLRTADAGARQLALEVLADGAGRLDRALAAINTALLEDGLLLRVADDTVVEHPVVIGVGTRKRKVWVQPRVIIEVGAGSSLTLLLQHHQGAGSLSNTISHVRCRRGARLRLIRLQGADDSAQLLDSSMITLEDGADAAIVSLDLGARLSRHEIHVSLDGSGASTRIDGLFIADGERHIDNQTRVEHRGRQTCSREVFHGILDGRGHGVFNGKVVVHDGAGGADARLNNRNLLLSDRAEIDTRPELEIFTDDVRCSHGATTGRLDPNALFYLRSRGLTLADATRMLLRAFAGEIAQRIGIGALDAPLDALVEARLSRAATETS